MAFFQVRDSCCTPRVVGAAPYRPNVFHKPHTQLLAHSCSPQRSRPIMQDATSGLIQRWPFSTSVMGEQGLRLAPIYGHSSFVLGAGGAAPTAVGGRGRPRRQAGVMPQQRPGQATCCPCFLRSRRRGRADRCRQLLAGKETTQDASSSAASDSECWTQLDTVGASWRLKCECHEDWASATQARLLTRRCRRHAAADGCRTPAAATGPTKEALMQLCTSVQLQGTDHHPPDVRLFTSISSAMHEVHQGAKEALARAAHTAAWPLCTTRACLMPRSLRGCRRSQA